MSTPPLKETPPLAAHVRAAMGQVQAKPGGQAAQPMATPSSQPGFAPHVRAGIQAAQLKPAVQQKAGPATSGGRALAAHVQAAMQAPGRGGGLPQPKAPAQSHAARPLAPHVQAAIGHGLGASPGTPPSVQAKPGATQGAAPPRPGAHVHHAVQAGANRSSHAAATGSRPSPGPGATAQPRMQPSMQPGYQVASPAVSSRRAGGAVQPKDYKNVVHDQEYSVSHLSGGGKFYLRLTEKGKSDELANMRYKFYADGMAVMEHVEAYGMPGGSRTGYLLFYIFAKHAKKAGATTVGIGTGVDEASATRNLLKARQDGDLEGEQEANRNLAAVHIYKQLGFDASDAVRLSNSAVTVDNVISVCVAKLKNNWLQEVEKESKKCFLTTACVTARGLPDDCEELTVLRAFRDGYLAATPAGRSLIDEYYRIAPGIVAAIAEVPDREEREALYASIYRRVRRCVEAIHASEHATALTQYRTMVRELAARFAPLAPLSTSH